MAIFRSEIVDLQVMPDVHEVVVICGSPARVEMHPSSAHDAVQGTYRLTLGQAERLVQEASDSLPVTISLARDELTLKHEEERAQFVSQIRDAVETARTVILSVDIPSELTSSPARRSGHVACPGFGGHRRHFQHRDDGSLRDVVEFEFRAEEHGRRPTEVFESMRGFYAEWSVTPCRGEVVEITLEDAQGRKFASVKQIVGDQAEA